MLITKPKVKYTFFNLFRLGEGVKSFEGKPLRFTYKQSYTSTENKLYITLSEFIKIIIPTQIISIYYIRVKSH